MKKAREAASQGRAPDVDRWLAEARSAGVSSAELNSFQRDLSAAKQKAVAAEADRIATLARDRIREGKLLEPANDSAAYYLGALQNADSNHSYLATGNRDLAAKLVDRANASVRANRLDQVEPDLAQARRYGADGNAIQAVQQALAARKTVPSRASSGAQNTASAAPAAPVDLSKSLKRIRSQDPEYPERALAQKINGSVTVEFTVNGKGEPTDVHVVAAEPAGIFDRSALAAVKRWRYAPVLVDSVPQEVPARAVIKFNSQE
jgi:TonB family protein